MATDVRTVSRKAILNFLEQDCYVRCRDGICLLLQRGATKTARPKTISHVSPDMVRKLLLSGKIKLSPPNALGYVFYVHIDKPTKYARRKASFAPRPCAACGKPITDATQSNQIYHKTAACQAIKKINMAKRQREYQKLRQKDLRQEAARNKPRVKKVRQKCLGPAAGTHYFLTDKPHLEHICPLCRNIQAGRTGGLDDANGVVF